MQRLRSSADDRTLSVPKVVTGGFNQCQVHPSSAHTLISQSGTRREAMRFRNQMMQRARILLVGILSVVWVLGPFQLCPSHSGP